MPTLTYILLLAHLPNKERRRNQIANVPFRNRVSLLAKPRQDRRIRRRWLGRRYQVLVRP